jgi:hypothetical protein
MFTDAFVLVVGLGGGRWFGILILKLDLSPGQRLR